MPKIALLDKCPSKINYGFDFDFDHFHLCSTKKSKILKRDVDLEGFDTDEYDFVILVGSEACKMYGIGAVSNYTGKLVDDKFLPAISPAALGFKPELREVWDYTSHQIHGYISGELVVRQVQGDYRYITNEQEALDYLEEQCRNLPILALDSETSALYCRDGYMLGISISHAEYQGVYIDSSVIDGEFIQQFQEIINETPVVFHNKKFDLHFFKFHFGLDFSLTVVHDTMAQHYVLDERMGTHGLKSLVMKYTDMGDYDADLDTFKKQYLKDHKMKAEDFSYDLIPPDIMWPYAAKDTDGTLRLHNKFYPIIQKNPQLSKVYNEIVNPGLDFLQEMEDNGAPLNMDRVYRARTHLLEKMKELEAELYTHEEVHEFEALQGDKFNANSVVQLRKLFFDVIGLPPTGKLTGTGAISTDAEVLTELSELHDIPRIVMEIKKSRKFLNTYIERMISGVDADGRLRTGFNLTSTTSGRLSSSGKINLQQLPRDDGLVKGCIQAPEGYSVVQMDLATAEMWVAAALSGDKNLMKVFQSAEGDFHSSIAHMVFKLPCPVSQVKKLYPSLRQAAKAVSFGILFGSAAQKVADTVTQENFALHQKTGCEFVPFTLEDAQDAIDEYFRTYPRLKRWIKDCKDQIKQHGFIYSEFGRKRRLHNVKSNDRGVAAGEVRSGFNAIIQGVSSDINLLGAMETHEELKLRPDVDAEIIMLVHDSICAVVKDEDIPAYKEILARCVQKDRGVMIPGSPVGLDWDIHRDYSDGKYEKQYPQLFAMEAA